MARCNKCGETYQGLAGDCRCTNYGQTLTKEESDVIRKEIREGTPDTPERVATMARADAAFAGMRFERPWEKRDPLDKPHRRFEIEVHIGADEWDTLVRDLLQVAAHVEEHGQACTSVMGGSDVGHSVMVIERPQMTHDLYIERLTAYLAEVHAREAATPGKKEGE